MCMALDPQVPIHKTFREKFNVAKLFETESSTQLMQSSKIKNCGAAFAKMEQFDLYAEAYRVVGKAIENGAGSLEICGCHQHLWARGNS